MALPSLTAPLLRRAQVRLRETADTGNRCVFLVGPDALIGPFPGGPVCRPYKGDRNLIPYPARATERVAPTSTCLKPDGRVRTPAPTAYTETVPSFVGAGHWPARRCTRRVQEAAPCGSAPVTPARHTQAQMRNRNSGNFSNPRAQWPGGNLDRHSDFARRKCSYIFQVRVPRNGGSRGWANMDTECPS